MYTTAYRILNDEAHAHDALQEGMIEVFRDIRKFRQESSLLHWMKTIVIHKSLRKLKQERRFESLDTMQYEEVTEWQDNLTGEFLDQAIRSLPAGYRAVFNLIAVEGYTHRETAQMLHISEGTSKSQLYHAKKLLQQKLKELL